MKEDPIMNLEIAQVNPILRQLDNDGTFVENYELVLQPVEVTKEAYLALMQRTVHHTLTVGVRDAP